MITNIFISIAFLLLLGLMMIHGRYAKAGIGEIPLIYKNIIIEFLLNIAVLSFFGLALFLIFYNWKLLLMLLVIGFITGNLVIVPIIERALFAVAKKHL
ncbi:MAG: hypothetical protein ACD_7C00020G0020 [uncultured bacterium]|nr:MAG: hypothetical protein ACD_7C00020G0020 [uncultured bacterium]HBR79843.1 hypothetical protein [Candidatus Moranbacteria bacterium]